MKVILLENIRKIGTIGQVVDVKRGFARNYLIANKKGLYASKENIKQVEKIKSELSNFLFCNVSDGALNFCGHLNSCIFVEAQKCLV